MVPVDDGNLLTGENMKIALWIWFVIVGAGMFALGFVGSCSLIKEYNTVKQTNTLIDFKTYTNRISTTNSITTITKKIVIVTNTNSMYSDISTTNTKTNINRRATTNE